MTTAFSRSAYRSLVLSLMLTFTLGVAACGADDDGDGAGSQADAGEARAGTESRASTERTPGATSGDGTKTHTAADPRETPPAGASDEQQIRATLWRMKGAIATQDGTKACADMSAEARGLLETSERSCAEGFETLPKVTEDPKPEILSIKVKGKEATMIAKAFDDGPEKVAQRTTFVKEKGEWKVEDWFTD